MLQANRRCMKTIILSVWWAPLRMLHRNAGSRMRTEGERLGRTMATANVFTLVDGSIEGFAYGYDITESVLSQKIMTMLEELRFDIIGILDVATGNYFMHDTVSDENKSVRGWGGDLTKQIEYLIRNHVPVSASVRISSQRCSNLSCRSIMR